MTNEAQPSLFPEEPGAPNRAPMTPAEQSEIARRIGETARKIVHADRTSDAARDQGHGVIELPSGSDTEPVVDVPVAASKPKTDRPLIEEPSRTRGSNAPPAVGIPDQEHRDARDRHLASQERADLKKFLRGQSQR